MTSNGSHPGPSHVHYAAGKSGEGEVSKSPPARPAASRSASILIPHRSSFSGQVSGDESDAINYSQMRFTLLDAAAIIFSICSFSFDIGTDVVVSFFHYLNRDYWYMGLTLTFVLLPTFVMTAISLRWYILDAREKGSPPISVCTWVTRVVFLLLQLGPILRYIDSLIYGLKSRRYKHRKDQQRKFFTYMTYEDTDAAFLRLFECYMEAAPQLVLQIYIVAKKNPYTLASRLISSEDVDHIWTILVQVTAILCSLISVAWSLVSYNRALRTSLRNKKNLTWQGTLFQFLWRFFVIAARVLALALFASVYRFYIGIVVGVHWFIMLIWIRSMGTTFCVNEWEERGYNAVLACMFIFAYFNPIDSPTRYRYLFYYTFMLAENTMLMAFWFFHPQTMGETGPEPWYRLPALVGHYTSWIVGLFFMAIYYLYFHPAGNIRICRVAEISADSNCENCGVCIEHEKETEKMRKAGFKPHGNGLWTTQARIPHPRPTVPPESTSSLNFNIFREKKILRKNKCQTKNEDSSLRTSRSHPESAAQALKQTASCIPSDSNSHHNAKDMIVSLPESSRPDGVEVTAV